MSIFSVFRPGPGLSIPGLAIAALSLMLSSAAGAAEDFPRRGSCWQDRPFVGGEVREFRVIWRGDTALVQIFGMDYDGKIAGLRPFNDGWRFSVFFDHDSFGPSEISVSNGGGAKAYKSMALVTYNIVDGERYLGGVFPVAEASCRLG